MVNNQKGAVIPYQPTYSIQYKYGNRYGPQSFASPTTSLGTAGQTGGPLSGQSTLDQTAPIDIEETAAPTTVAQSGDGETLDSGAPGGTGGADFSQFREGYIPVQPDLGWLYANSYGNNPFVAPPTSNFGGFNNTTTSTTDSIIPAVIEGGENSTTTNDGISSRSMGDDKISIFGFEFGNPSAPDAGDGGGPTGDPDDDDTGNVDMGNPSNVSMGNDMTNENEDGTNADNDQGTSNTSSGYDNQGPDNDGSDSSSESQSDASENNSTYDGALMMPRGVPKRPRDKRSNINYSQGLDMEIPNPLFQDPLADLFRRT